MFLIIPLSSLCWNGPLVYDHKYVFSYDIDNVFDCVAYFYMDMQMQQRVRFLCVLTTISGCCKTAHTSTHVLYITSFTYLV